MMNVSEQEKPERMAFSITDAAWVLGDVSENHVRNLISDGVLKKVRIGRRVMVEADSIKRLIAAGGTSAEKVAA